MVPISRPMAPAPTTSRDLGGASKSSASVLVTTSIPSALRKGRSAERLPVARMTAPPRRPISPSGGRAMTVRSSRSRAVPLDELDAALLEQELDAADETVHDLALLLLDPGPVADDLGQAGPSRVLLRRGSPGAPWSGGGGAWSGCSPSSCRSRRPGRARTGPHSGPAGRPGWRPRSRPAPADDGDVLLADVHVSSCPGSRRVFYHSRVPPGIQDKGARLSLGLSAFPPPLRANSG